MPGHRRGVDDVPVAVLDEVRQERAVAVDDAPQVDLEHPAPLVLDDPLAARRPDAGDAGVVAQHVHAAERVDRRVAQAVDRVAVGHVRRNADRLSRRWR